MCGKDIVTKELLRVNSNSEFISPPPKKNVNAFYITCALLRKEQRTWKPPAWLNPFPSHCPEEGDLSSILVNKLKTYSGFQSSVVFLHFPDDILHYGVSSHAVSITLQYVTYCNIKQHDWHHLRGLVTTLHITQDIFMGSVKKKRKKINMFHWTSHPRCRGKGKKGSFEDFCNIPAEGTDKHLLSKWSQMSFLYPYRMGTIHVCQPVSGSRSTQIAPCSRLPHLIQDTLQDHLWKREPGY